MNTVGEMLKTMHNSERILIADEGEKVLYRGYAGCLESAQIRERPSPIEYERSTLYEQLDMDSPVVRVAVNAELFDPEYIGEHKNMRERIIEIPDNLRIFRFHDLQMQVCLELTVRQKE
ncbi:MAG: hypothetical protein IJ567_06375 [Lachnospiraceae bacterium]|nr:hypothetical protein [Lachnospiraceae bacterium]